MKFRKNFNQEEFNKEVYRFFSEGIDVENEEIKKLRLELELAQAINRDLRGKIAKLEGENKNLKENPRNKKYLLNNIRERIENEYDFLSKEGREILISTEYLYLNENEDIDYSGVYIGYIKLLEIELKGKVSVKENITFGSLIEKIEQVRVFNSLVQELGKNRVIDNRNRGAHNGIIKKIECGRIRNVLIEEGWLRRVVEYFQDNLVEETTEEEIDLF